MKRFFRIYAAVHFCYKFFVAFDEELFSSASVSNHQDQEKFGRKHLALCELFLKMKNNPIFCIIFGELTIFRFYKQDKD